MSAKNMNFTFDLVYLNIRRSLSNKINELEILTKQTRPHAVLLTET